MVTDTSAVEMSAFKQSLTSIKHSTSKIKGGCLKHSTSRTGLDAKRSDSRTMVWVDKVEPDPSTGKDMVMSFMSRRRNQMDALLKTGKRQELKSGATDDTKEPAKEVQKELRFMEPSRSNLSVTRKDSKTRVKKKSSPKKKGLKKKEYD